jgi:hypothetical protein
VPLALDGGAVQIAIPIARHHPIGFDDQGLVAGDWRIAGWWLLRRLDLRHGRPLLAFQVGPDRLGMGAQRLGADLHAGQGLQQLGGFGKGRQAAQQCFPVLQPSTGPLFSR